MVGIAGTNGAVVCANVDAVGMMAPRRMLTTPSSRKSKRKCKRGPVTVIILETPWLQTVRSLPLLQMCPVQKGASHSFGIAEEDQMCPPAQFPKCGTHPTQKLTLQSSRGGDIVSQRKINRRKIGTKRHELFAIVLQVIVGKRNTFPHKLSVGLPPSIPLR